MVKRWQYVAMRAATAIVVTLGVLLVVLSTVFVSSFLAVLGLGLVFWGCILLFVSPVRHVPFDLVEAAVDVNANGVERVLVELDLVEKGVYLPPKNLKDIESSLVFVPFSQAIPASVEEIIPPPLEPPTEYTNKTTATAVEVIAAEPTETIPLEAILETEPSPFESKATVAQPELETETGVIPEPQESADTEPTSGFEEPEASLLVSEATASEQELIPEETTFEKTAEAAEPASEIEEAILVSDEPEETPEKTIEAEKAPLNAVEAEVEKPIEITSASTTSTDVPIPKVAITKPDAVPGVVKVVEVERISVESVSATAVVMTPTEAKKMPNVRYGPSVKAAVETGFAAVFDAGIDMPSHSLIGKTVRTKVEGDVGKIVRYRGTGLGSLVLVEFKWETAEERKNHSGLDRESVWFWEDEVEVVELKPSEDLDKIVKEAVTDVGDIGAEAVKELEEL